MAVLILIIIIDIAVMAVIMRLVRNEPPHKHPSTHPLAIQYATRSEAPAPLVAEQTAPADEEDGKTELGE